MNDIDVNGSLGAAKQAVRVLTKSEFEQFRKWLNQYAPKVVTPKARTSHGIQKYFETDGDIIRLKPGIHLSTTQFAAVAKHTRNQSHTVYALNEAYKAGKLTDVLRLLRASGMTGNQEKNFKHIASSVIPFMVEHDLKCNPYTVAQVIGALRHRDGRKRTSIQAEMLLSLLREKNVSQAQAEARRDEYGRFPHDTEDRE